MKNTNKKPAPPVALDRLVRRLSNHIAAMAPYQKTREQGALLIEAAAKLVELNKDIKGYTATMQLAAMCLEDQIGLLKETQAALGEMAKHSRHTPECLSTIEKRGCRCWIADLLARLNGHNSGLNRPPSSIGSAR